MKRALYETPIPSQYIFRVESRFISRRVYPDQNNINSWIDLGFGPYVLGMNWHPGIKSALTDILRKNEPCQLLNYDYGKLEKAGRSLHAMWTQPRPGPSEDPYLRDWFRSLSRSEQLNLAYGFRTKEQIFEWFFDVDSIRSLIDHQFDVHQYRSKHIVHGLRQSVVDISKPFNRVKVYTLVEIVKEFL